MFSLWEERKKAWNVSLLLRNGESACVFVCVHLCVCTIIRVRSGVAGPASILGQQYY